MRTLPRKDQIRLKAQVLFREKGYVASSMRDIADTLGIEAASLYNHISSKEEILQDICFSMAESFFVTIEPISTEDITPDEKLKKAITAHIGVIAANSDASAVFLHEWRHLGNASLSDFKLMRRRYERIFGSMLDDGIRTKAFRVVDVPLTVRTLLSAMNWTYEWYNPKGKVDPTAMSEHICKLMLDGLRS